MNSILQWDLALDPVIMDFQGVVTVRTLSIRLFHRVSRGGIKFLGLFLRLVYQPCERHPGR